MTPYELWKGRSTIVKHFKVFGNKCYIKRNDENLGKNDSRADKWIFVGYATRSKAYKCYELRLEKMVENPNVKLDAPFMHKIFEYSDNQPMFEQFPGDTQKEENMEGHQEETCDIMALEEKITRRRIRRKTWYKGSLQVCLEESFRGLNYWR